MKPYNEEWTEEEINSYIDKNNVLVLFHVDVPTNTACMIVYGTSINSYQKDDLKYQISKKFGGKTLTNTMCENINEFAEKWYNKYILNKKARTINKTKDK